jgi:hypothetical protein
MRVVGQWLLLQLLIEHLLRRGVLSGSYDMPEAVTRGELQTTFTSTHALGIFLGSGERVANWCVVEPVFAPGMSAR